MSSQPQRPCGFDYIGPAVDLSRKPGYRGVVAMTPGGVLVALPGLDTFKEKAIQQGGLDLYCYDPGSVPSLDDAPLPGHAAPMREHHWRYADQVARAMARRAHDPRALSGFVDDLESYQNQQARIAAHRAAGRKSARYPASRLMSDPLAAEPGDFQ